MFFDTNLSVLLTKGLRDERHLWAIVTICFVTIAYTSQK